MALTRAARFRPRRGRSGSASERGGALLEVVVSLSLLAVALVALQGVLLAAVHATAGAGSAMRAATLGATLLEEALADLRADRLPAPLHCEAAADGLEFRRTVELADEARLARVDVHVAPAGGVAGEPLHLTAHVFSPHGFAPADQARECP